MGQPRRAGSTVALGSIKSNIGHLEGAAGVVGLIKAVLCLERRQWPPVALFATLNPHISLAGTAVVIPTTLTPWESGTDRRVAGVSSFGWSGTNAHVVLEEAPASVTPSAANDGRPRLLPISARTPDAFAAQVRGWVQWCQSHAPAALADVASTAALRRAHCEYRGAVVGSTVAECGAALDAITRGESHPHVLTGRRLERGGIVFVFPGQGSQWVGMGRQLLESEPVFRDAIDRCETAMSAYVSWSLVEELRAESTRSRLSAIEVVQPVLFSVEVALAALWRSWGVEPDAVVGHSMGEVAAAHVAGALTLDDAARVICERSRLLRRISGKGAMAALELSLDDAAVVIQGYQSRLSIAASNSPGSTVISGDVDAVAAVMADLQARDVFCRAIKVDVASHSPQVDALADDLLTALGPLRPVAATLPVYSTVTTAIETGVTLNAEYWVRNLRQPVLLSQTIARLAADGHTTFIEISPHPILLPAIETSLAALGRPAIVVPSLRRDEDERKVVLGSAARLYVQGGCDLDWRTMNGPGGFVEVPQYPYQRERFWLAAAPVASASMRPVFGAADRHPLLTGGILIADRPGVRVWQFALDPRRVRFLRDHELEGAPLLAASVTIELMLAAGAQQYGDVPLVIDALELLRPLTFGADTRSVLQVSARPLGDGRSEVHIHSVEETASRLLARAGVRAATSHDVTDPPPCALTGVAGSIGHERFYADLEARGIRIGDTLRTVASVTAVSQGVEAWLELSDEAVSRSAKYYCDPAAMDGLLQLMVLAAGDDARLHVPSRIREIRWHRKPSRQMIAGAKRVAVDASNGRMEQDLWLARASGARVLELAGVQLRTLDRTVTRAPERVEDWLYEIAWVAKPVESQPTVKHQSKVARWLVFADRTGVGDALVAWLGRKGQQAAVVTPGEAFTDHGAGRFTVRRDSDTDLQRLFDATVERDDMPCRGVVFLWPIDEASAPADAAGFVPDICGSTIAALRIVQRLVGRERSQPPRLWIVTRGAQPVDGQVPAPWQAPLWGLGRVTAEEHHESYGGLIDLDPGGGSRCGDGRARGIHLGRRCRARDRLAGWRAVRATAGPLALERAARGPLVYRRHLSRDRRVRWRWPLRCPLDGGAGCAPPRARRAIRAAAAARVGRARSGLTARRLCCVRARAGGRGGKRPFGARRRQ